MRFLPAVLVGLALGILCTLGIQALRREEAAGPQDRDEPQVASSIPESAGDTSVADPGPSPSGLSDPESRAVDPSARDAETDPESAAETALDTEALSALVDAKDFAALAAALEKLLLGGEEGHAALLEFLRAQGRPPRHVGWLNGPLSLVLLSLALEHEEEASRFLRQAIADTDPAKDLVMHDQFLRAIPNLLAYWGDRESALRTEFEDSLLGELETPRQGTNLWRLFETLTQIGKEVPLEAIERLLADPAQKTSASVLLHELARREGRESSEMLLRYIQGAADPRDWSVRQALQSLARRNDPVAEEGLRGHIASEVKEVREGATLAWFSKPRDLSSLPVAIEFLNSESDLNQKRMLLWQLRGQAPEVLDAVRADIESLPAEDVRDLVQKDGAAMDGAGMVKWAVSAPGNSSNVKVIQVEAKN